jgi:hypothetical protein
MFGMNLRRCTPCQGYFPLAAFAWRRIDRGYRDTFCYRCRATYKRGHYRANRERYIRNARARQTRVNAERFEYLLDYLRANPCVDCEESDPMVLEFDHIGPKRFDISSGIRNRNWEDVLTEIAACEVVCANCHRRRTYRRAGAWRHRPPGDEASSESRASYGPTTASLPVIAGVAQW